MPSCLLPRTILRTDHASSSPLWDVTGPQALSDTFPDPSVPSSFPFSSFSNDPNLPNNDQTLHSPSNSLPSLPQTNNVNPPSLDNNSHNNDNTNADQQHQNEEQQPPNQEQQQQQPQSLIPHLTIKIPPQCQAACLCTTANITDHTSAFISKYIPVRNTHDLFSAHLSINDFSSVDNVLSALTDGSLKPTVGPDDKPLRTQAINSDKQEYWITGGHNELQSLQDLKVFILVPCSKLPHGHHPLKGNLCVNVNTTTLGRLFATKSNM